MTQRTMVGARLTAAALVLGMAMTAVAASPDERLATAVKDQNSRAALALLKAGVDVNGTLADGSSPLLWAAHWGDGDLVDRLLRAGARVNAADDTGVAPLHRACENGQAELVARLLGAGADPNAAQANGVTPLLIAARTGRVGILKALLARGAIVNAVPPSTGQTALMWAASEAHHDAMRELIEAGAGVRASSKTGFTPLLFTARNGDIDGAKLLLAAGARVNDTGSDGTHALPLAILAGQDAYARFLLAAGADPNGMIGGVSALHAAAGRVDDWMRNWMRGRKQSDSLIVGLERTARLPMVKALLAAGANPNIRTTAADSLIRSYGITGNNGARETYSTGVGSVKGATPLWVITLGASGGSGGVGGRGGSLDPGADPVGVVRALLEAGADASIPTEDGTTPLMVAAGLGSRTRDLRNDEAGPAPVPQAIIRLLLDAGADVNAVNEAGFTPLHGAAFRGSKEVIQMLVDKGARLNVRDWRGRTPYLIARGAQQGFFIQCWAATAEFLKSIGADPDLGFDSNRIDAAAVETERERLRLDRLQSQAKAAQP